MHFPLHLGQKQRCLNFWPVFVYHVYHFHVLRVQEVVGGHHITNQITVSKLFVLDRNTWNHICKQKIIMIVFTIIIIKKEYLFKTMKLCRDYWYEKYFKPYYYVQIIYVKKCYLNLW